MHKNRFVCDLQHRLRARTSSFGCFKQTEKISIFKSIGTDFIYAKIYLWLETGSKLKIIETESLGKNGAIRVRTRERANEPSADWLRGRGGGEDIEESGKHFYIADDQPFVRWIFILKRETQIRIRCEIF